jgi:hypothetical protein
MKIRLRFIEAWLTRASPCRFVSVVPTATSCWGSPGARRARLSAAPIARARWWFPRWKRPDWRTVGRSRHLCRVSSCSKGMRSTACWKGRRGTNHRPSPARRAVRWLRQRQRPSLHTSQLRLHPLNLWFRPRHCLPWPVLAIRPRGSGFPLPGQPCSACSPLWLWRWLSERDCLSGCFSSLPGEPKPHILR